MNEAKRQRRVKKSAFILVFVVALGASLALHIALSDWAYDDAYIHFHIARNLAKHGQPYFNLGDAVKGSSSTVWTIVLAGVFRLSGVRTLSVSVLNSTTVVAAGATYGLLTLRFFPGQRVLAWTAGLLAGLSLLPASVGLMETGLALLFLGLAVVMLHARRPAGFALLAVAFFTRPEMAIFILVIITASIVTRLFSFRTIALYGGLAAVPFLLYDLAFFRTPIPHAAVAKSIVFPLTWQESLGMVLLPMDLDVPPSVISLAAILFLALGLLATLVLWERATTREFDGWTRWLLVTLPLGACLLIVAYVLAGTFVFPWYIPLYVAPLTVGAAWMIASTRRLVPALAGLMLLVPSLWIATALVLGAVDRDQMGDLLSPNARALQLGAIGKALQAECAGCRVLAPEIGALGYYFEGRIIDAVGLVSPEALDFHPMAVPEERSSPFLGAIPVGLADQTNPEFVVFLEGFGQSLMRSTVGSGYRVLTCPVSPLDDSGRPIKPKIFGTSELFVLIRDDLVPIDDRVFNRTRALGCDDRTPAVEP